MHGDAQNGSRLSTIPGWPAVVGQAKPSVFTRFGAPRRLLTSRQGRTGEAAVPTPDERVEEGRQAGQSSGVRGLRRRWIVVRMVLTLE
jgi:hypothetical protein